MSSGVLKMKAGTFIGTGAAQDIKLNFNPTFVHIINTDDLSECMNHINNDVSTKEGGFKRVAAGTRTALAAAAGITLGDNKFSVGTDASCNASGKKMLYVAYECNDQIAS